MALLELITEQHGVDKDGNHWILNHVNPPVWELSEEWNDDFLDTSEE